MTSPTMRRFTQALLGRAIWRFGHLALIHAVAWAMTTFLVYASETAAYGQGRTPLEILHQEFRRRATRSDTDHTALLWGLAVFVGLVVVLMVIAWLINYFQQRRPYFSHTLLFLELCCVHRMRIKDILLLWKWTSRDKIRPRSLIFVDPGLWQSKLDHNLLNVTAGSVAAQTTWNRLYTQLFGAFVPQLGQKLLPAETAMAPATFCENQICPPDASVGGDRSSGT